MATIPVWPPQIGGFKPTPITPLFPTKQRPGPKPKPIVEPKP